MKPEDFAARKWALETEIQILKNRLLDGTTLKVLGKRIEELEELIERAQEGANAGGRYIKRSLRAYRHRIVAYGSPYTGTADQGDRRGFYG